jgi:hypothetical protein
VILRATQEEAVSTGRYERTIAIHSNEQLLSGPNVANGAENRKRFSILDNGVFLPITFRRSRIPSYQFKSSHKQALWLLHEAFISKFR